MTHLFFTGLLFWGPVEPEDLALLERDTAWVQSFKSGDPKGFENLFKAYIQDLIQFVQRFGDYQIEEAEDHAHEIMLRAYENLSRFVFRAKFRTWLFTIAVNHIKNERSKHQTISLNSPVQGQESGQMQDQLVSSSDSPEDAIHRKDLQVRLDEAMALLNEKERAVFILREYQDLTFQEISDITGQTLRNIQFLKDKANLKIQHFLSHHGLLKETFQEGAHG